ncbi:GPI anchored dioxygenase [Botrytis cinerea]
MEEMIYCNSSCILSLEGETGPFYVSGEHIRSNLRETQAGVPLVIDGQFLDSTACEPIQDLYWDIWNCNSTGIYGGIPASPINDNVGLPLSSLYIMRVKQIICMSLHILEVPCYRMEHTLAAKSPI